MIRQYTLTVTTTGSPGSATGSATTAATVRGRILAVGINYHASAPGTTDVTIATVTAPANTILTVTDNATDGWYYPRHQVHSGVGAGLTYDGTRTVCEQVPVCDQVVVSVAGSNALTACVVVYLIVDRP